MVFAAIGALRVCFFHPFAFRDGVVFSAPNAAGVHGTIPCPMTKTEAILALRDVPMLRFIPGPFHDSAVNRFDGFQLLHGGGPVFKMNQVQFIAIFPRFVVSNNPEDSSGFQTTTHQLLPQFFF